MQEKIDNTKKVYIHLPVKSKLRFFAQTRFSADFTWGQSALQVSINPFWSVAFSHLSSELAPACSIQVTSLANLAEYTAPWMQLPGKTLLVSSNPSAWTQSPQLLHHFEHSHIYSGFEMCWIGAKAILVGLNRDNNLMKGIKTTCTPYM